MPFLLTILQAYGIHASKDPTKGLSNDTGDVCAKMADKRACAAKLVGNAAEDDALHRDGKRFLELHIDLLRMSRADTTNARIQMIKDVYSLIPWWLQIVIVFVGIAFMITLGITGIVILVHLKDNPVAMGKVFALSAFTVAIIVAYAWTQTFAS
jgi:hypothetical protein